MKFKKLFLGMLGAAALVSCNNDAIDPNPNPNGGETGEAAYATFFFKSATTYAGGNVQAGTGDENKLSSAVMAIYKDGTNEPEALAYVNASPLNSKVTLKCKTGTKKIYLAVNVGNSVSTKPGASSTILVYGNTDITTANDGSPYNGPYDGSNGTVFADTVNALMVASAAATYTNDFTNTMLTAVGTLPTANVSAAGLIQGMTGNGTVANGVLTGDGNGTSSAFLMSNWSGDDDVATGGTNAATCVFTLVKATAADSRGATAPDATKNAFTINVQRAVAKIAMNIAANAATSPYPATKSYVAGAGTNVGAASVSGMESFCVGNIAKAEYPFQQFDGSIVKSAAYDAVDSIKNQTTKQWQRYMDNTRLYGSYDFSLYPTSKTTVDVTVANIQATPNIAFTSTSTPAYNAGNCVLVTENNNSQTYDAYTTFVCFAAEYIPAEVVTAAPVGSTDATCTKTPGMTVRTSYTATGKSTDTLYYVKDANYTLLAEGKFFYGDSVLIDYMLNVIGIIPSDIDAQLAEWQTVTGVGVAKMQAYYNGKCFYRIWVADNAAKADDASKYLVRRNHIYMVNVTKFNGPGIGDPHEILNPGGGNDPGPHPIGEQDTYVTATINVLDWHLVTQDTPVGF